jgi:adenylosuccinate lyase
MEEPFEKNQIGSSAMPYKRNPMRTERICALARYVIADTINPAITAGTQWFERTLDDSANRRISISEAFMAIDAILGIYINVTSGLVVYPKVVESRIMKELPFIASENIMMGLVKKGGDRQEIHEKIRVHSIAAGKRVKEEGLENDMIERICNDPTLDITLEEIKEILVPSKYIGRCVEQVENFLANDVDPLLAGVDGIKVDLAV